MKIKKKVVMRMNFLNKINKKKNHIIHVLITNKKKMMNIKMKIMKKNSKKKWLKKINKIYDYELKK